MSKISAGVKKTINEVKRLADGSFDNQIYACKELLRKKIFPGGKLRSGIDKSVVPLLLPTIMKFMESENQVLQKEAVDAIICLTYTLDVNATEILVNETGIVPKLMKLLSSTTDFNVTLFVLHALLNIAFKYPAAIIENQVLPHMIKYLQSENKQILHYAAWLMTNIACHGEKCVTALFEANVIEPLIKVLESKNNDACIRTLYALIHIVSCNLEICQRALDVGALSFLKKLCNRVLAVKKVNRNTTYSSERKIVKLLVIRFIKKITSYGEILTDRIINEDFIPLILRQISDGITSQIKIESIETIKDIIVVKPSLLTSLINDQNLFSFYYNNLARTNATLITSVLTAMKNVITMFDDKEASRQKIHECGGSTKLAKLLLHENEEIRRLAHLINQFVNGDVKPVPTAASNNENTLIELNDEAEDAAFAVAGTSQTNRRQKRPAKTQEGPLRRSKRFRISYEQIDLDRSVTPANDDTYNDFDDHPGRYSPANSRDTVASNDEATGDSSIPTNHPPAISGTVEADVFNDGIVESDEKKPLVPQKFSPSDDFDNPSRPLSRQSPALPVAASTNDDENFVVEKKSSTDAASAHPSVPVETTAANIITTAVSTTSDDPSSQATTVSPSVSLLPITDQTTPPANDIYAIETKPSPTSSHPIVPVEITAANINTANAIATTSDDSLRQATTVPQTSPLPLQTAPPANDIFPSANSSVNYCCPAEFLIRKYCSHLEIQFNRKNYAAFIQKIELTEITSNSAPATFYSTDCPTGFGCLSMLLTGSEDQANTIRMQINKEFVCGLTQSGNFDEQKITQVIAPPFTLKAEHFETTVAWFNCRIMIYSNGKWEQYGDFDAADESIPLFILAKNATQGSTHFDIVLSLKRDDQ